MTDAPTYPDWPKTRWRLTTPETHSVLAGPKASGSEAFKLSLMELVARRALALDDSAEQGHLIATRRVAALRDGARAEPPGERALAATWNVYQRAPRNARSNGEPAVAVADLARAAAKRYGSLKRYLAREVLPALEERGISEARKTRVLGIFPITRHPLTAQGEAARAELQQWLDVGRERFAGWTVSDAHQALAYAGPAGAVLLLMPSLFPELRRLREQLPDTTTADDDWDGSPITIGSASYVGTGDFGALDFTGSDFGSLDVSVLGGLEAAMSAIDSAVDAIGGDSAGGSDSGGGGDSGGGESGGGGDSAGGGSDSSASGGE